jgi:hypothetical protein
VSYARSAQSLARFDEVMEWRAFDLPICLAQDRLEVWAIVGIKLADTIALRARHRSSAASARE